MTADLTVGSQVPIGFYRDGKLGTLKVTIAEFPGARCWPPTGFRVRRDSQGGGGPEDRRDARDRPGCPRGPAGASDFNPVGGILGVGLTPVHAKAEYDAAVAAAQPRTGTFRS